MNKNKRPQAPKRQTRQQTNSMTGKRAFAGDGERVRQGDYARKPKHFKGWE